MTLSTTQVSAQDWNNLAKYATGAAINHTETPWYSCLGGMFGLQAGIWTFSNRKDLKGGFKALGQEAKANKAIMNAARTQTKGVKGIWQGAKDIAANDALINLNRSLANKGTSYKGVKNAVKTAIDNKDYTAATRKTIEKLHAEANLKNYTKKVNIQRAKGGSAKALRLVKDKTGITKLATKNKTLLAKSGTARSLSKCAKGGGAMAIISAAFEIPTVYETYKELGTKSGNKQLVKSTVNIAAETAGWIAGAEAGGYIGAAVGTCIGGPVGTVVGGAIGVACGLLGSWLAGKASRAIVGKDEIEIAEEKQAEEIAQAAQDDPELQQQLALAALEQLETEGDNLSEDGKIAKESLEKVVNSMQTDDEISTETFEETAGKTSDKTSTETSEETSDETSTTSSKSTKSNKTKSKSTTDAGLNALADLAGSSSSSTTSVTNPYGSSAFNPFMMNNYTGYNSFNPFMMGGFSYTNPFMMNSYTGYNSFNPFMTGGYSGLNMFNPYQLYMAA